MIKTTNDEIDYKVKFTQDYFNPKLCKYDNERIDIILLDKKGGPLLYIEAKTALSNTQAREKALAQIVLTNKKQSQILNHLALIYKEMCLKGIIRAFEKNLSLKFNTSPHLF